MGVIVLNSTRSVHPVLPELVRGRTQDRKVLGSIPSRQVYTTLAVVPLHCRRASGQAAVYGPSDHQLHWAAVGGSTLYARQRALEHSPPARPTGKQRLRAGGHGKATGICTVVGPFINVAV